jgi:hypothetical protein
MLKEVDETDTNCVQKIDLMNFQISNLIDRYP